MMTCLDIMRCVVRRTSRFADIYRMAYGKFPSPEHAQDLWNMLKIMEAQNREHGRNRMPHFKGHQSTL